MRTWLTLLVVAASVSVWAQSTPAPPAQAEQTPQGPTFRTGVDVITVDVSAVDSAGKPVSDLRGPDFVVKIDGQPRRVVSVEAVKFDVEAVKRQLAADPFESFFSTNQSAPNSRLIVLAVDQLNIQPGNVRQLLQSASRFLDTLSPLDRVAFFAYPEPGVSIDFTTDHARIRKGMETVVGSQQRFESKFNIGLYEAIQSILRDDEVMRTKVFTRECRRLSGQALDECIRQVMSEMALMVNRTREDRHRSVESLEGLLQGLALVNAPKALIMMSEGLVLDDPSDVDGIVRAASRAQASINVLMMDVIRGSDIGRGAVMPPTMSEDRDLQTNGLRELAFASRGSLFNVYGNGQPIFDRLTSELSQYYLIAVEEETGDRDAKAHRIDVEVRRQGVTLRSRRAFVLAAPRPGSTGNRLNDLLRAPFGVAEVPLRVTTYAIQDSKTPKVRLLLAAEVDQAGSAPAPYTIGWMLLDRDGRVAASGGENLTLNPTRPGNSAALEFRTQALVEPGIYSLRMAVIDKAGRRGGVMREVNAWKMAGEDFAVADLVVGAPPERGQTLIASVEPALDTTIAAVVEIYSTTPASFATTQVTFEVAAAPESPALLSAKGELLEGGQATSRTAQAVIPAQALPAGRYVVRARIARDGTVVGLMARPFVLESARAGSPAVLPVLNATLSIPPFDRAQTLTPALVSEFMTVVERRSPSLKAAVAEARAGRYGAGSLEALDAGDQEVAAFFKGLDLYTKGQLEQAATQLNVAAGARREFFPAAFFLGAALAASGRDRDAASVWQMGIGNEQRPAITYTLFADARFRDKQPQSVVDVLQPAWERTRANDDIARRLASALVMTGKFAEALPVFEGYLSRHPDDQDSLIAAIKSQYEATTRAGLALSTSERTRLNAWSRAYTGPQRALVDRYIEILR